jgi:tripartite-type tricarboxylate transporter receptor subunit TctC
MARSFLWDARITQRFYQSSEARSSMVRPHVAEFKTLAGGLNVVHVPYRGSAPLMTDLIGGQISMAFDATPTALPQALSGAIRGIEVIEMPAHHAA